MARLLRTMGYVVAALILLRGISLGAAELPLPGDAVATHSVELAGRAIAYTAMAGSLALSNDKGDKAAEVFFVAYTLKTDKAAARPITFAFNGGPGAASAYLQLGAIGPRVLDFGNGRALPLGEGVLRDNPDSWLDFTH